MITTTLCYSATLGSSVADYGTPCTVDMGNVGYNTTGDDSELRRLGIFPMVDGIDTTDSE